MTSLLGNGSTISRLMLPKQFLSMNGVGGRPHLSSVPSGIAGHGSQDDLSQTVAAGV